jgi:hypothetical protein
MCLTSILDTFASMSSEAPKQKRGRPAKSRPDPEAEPKRPIGRPRKPVDSDQPASAPRPVGRPRHVSAFGSNPSQRHVVSVM